MFTLQMKFNDNDDVSQFKNDNQQKGFMTFYEEQWDEAHKQKKHKENIVKNQIDQANHQMLKIKQLAKDFRKIRRSALNELTDNIEIKSHQSIPKKVKQIKLPVKIQQPLKQVIKPFNFITRKKTLPSFSSKEIKVEKENQCPIISEPKIMKEKLPKIKQIKNYSTVHIRMIPFQHNQPTNSQNDFSRMSSEIPNTRFKKGSSFKGFHRQNFSISTVGLSKDILLECHKKVDKELDQLSKNQNSIGGYAINPLKQVSNYLFPVDSSECSFMRKLTSRNMETNEDSLQKFCKLLPNRRHHRNTVNTASYTPQHDFSC